MLRIVSLIASASEIVASLGLSRYQVGRSHECDFPPEILTLPICTAPAFPTDGSSAEIDQRVKQRVADALSVYEVSRELLDALQPTHVITQTQCRVCAVSLEDVERALTGWVTSRPKLVALEPNALADVWSDIRRVAAACGVAERGDEAVADLQAQIQRISERACDRKTPPASRLHRMARAVDGRRQLGARTSRNGRRGEFVWQGGRAFAVDDVAAIDGRRPRCHHQHAMRFRSDRTSAEMYWLTERPEWRKLRAVETGQVYLADGNQYFNRPGPRLVDSLQILAEILHPEAFEPALEGMAWRAQVQLAA